MFTIQKSTICWHLQFSKNGISRASQYDMRKQSVLYSFCIHLALILLLLVMAAFSNYTTGNFHSVTALENPRPVQHLVAPQLRVSSEAGSEGGGHRNPLPVERGEIPHVAKLFIQPALRLRETAQIVLPSGLEEMPQIATDRPIGIPSGIIGTQSAGPGAGTGMGTGDGNKAGPGQGKGPGAIPGDGSGTGPRQRLSALPQILWKIEPEYSEEARKARFQGSVMLAMEVDSEGKPRNIRVVRSLGMGLDERAMDAVSRWRFKPGLLNGRPVDAPVSVEVSFRLL